MDEGKWEHSLWCFLLSTHDFDGWLGDSAGHLLIEGLTSPGIEEGADLGSVKPRLMGTPRVSGNLNSGSSRSVWGGGRGQG